MKQAALFHRHDALTKQLASVTDRIIGSMPADLAKLGYVVIRKGSAKILVSRAQATAKGGPRVRRTA
jgi:hypothetical protein